MTIGDAIEFISSLRHGDRVTMTREGTSHEMTVHGRPSRSDGPAGEYQSVGVTLTLGPGRWSTRVEALHLSAECRGPGSLGGGTELRKIG